MIIGNDITIEEIIIAFEEKYGDDFNWSLISEANSFYLSELKKEVGADIRCFRTKSVPLPNANPMMMFYI